MNSIFRLSAVLLFLSMEISVEGSRCVFKGDFAPQEGSVKSPEQPLRRELCLNGAWRFQPVPVPHGYEWDKGIVPELPEPDPAKWEKIPIKIPSPWNANHWGNGPDVGPGTDRPYVPDSVYYPSYPGNWIHYHMAWMEKIFRVPDDWPEGNRLVLHFESVAGACEVKVNGCKVGEHFDKYLPFDLDVTDALVRGRNNTVQIGVRSYRLYDKRDSVYNKMTAPYPNGSNSDRLSGIWQDVSLLCLPGIRVKDVFVKPMLDLDLLEFEVSVLNETPGACSVKISGSVMEWINLAGKDVFDAPVPKWKLGEKLFDTDECVLDVPANGGATYNLKVKPAGRLKEWSPGNPALYAVLVNLEKDNRKIDVKYQRFGWRQFGIEGRNLMLNGRKINLRGDICHPFGAYMWSRRFVWSWYRMIKDMHGNAVRPHAQIYPRCYIELADEMGICVLDETAVFGSSIRSNFRDGEFWSRYADHFKGLIMRDRSNPSVFGWSFGNEMFAIFRLNNVNKEDEKLWYDKLTAVGLEGLKYDPTRPWVSCDGDEDLFGKLPVWSKHYGHNLPPVKEHVKDIQKPLMVGENGGTYYARPVDLAVFAGERAYLDYAGRNDALGIDVYQNIVKMAIPNDLAYFSASETVWFGLETLPFGFNDFQRIPGKEDGIFFEGVSGEGKFGMQIERLPPYVATLNPGWDSRLPIYKPLGMFLAQQAAQDPRGPQPCKWDNFMTGRKPQDASAPTIEKVSYCGGEKLAVQLQRWGVAVDQETKKFMVVDGGSLSKDVSSRINSVLRDGGNVLIMIPGIEVDSAALSALLPDPVVITSRKATSLVRGDDSHPWSASFDLASLYFAEEEPESVRQIMQCGLTGPFVEKGTVVLKASRTDWSLFNRRSEESKVGAVACYENHIKPEGAALVVQKINNGEIALCSIDFKEDSPSRCLFWSRLFNNIGVKTGVSRKGGSPEKEVKSHDLLLDGPQN